MLRSVPLPNTAARFEAEGETLHVYVRRVKPWFMVPPLSWIVPFRMERRVTLDSLGLRLLRLCDGERTVEAIIDIFAEENGLTFHESRAAVTQYMKALIQRGVLAVAVPEDELADATAEESSA